MNEFLGEMVEEIREYVRDDVNTKEFVNRESLEQSLIDELGNSFYSLNHAESKEFVLDNIDLTIEALTELDMDKETVGDKFLSKDWCWLLAMLRQYYLPFAVAEALDEMEEELVFEE